MVVIAVAVAVVVAVILRRRRRLLQLLLLLLLSLWLSFQVRNRTDAGLKRLLEVAMRCSLVAVDVYELRELRLDSWRDLKDFLSELQSAQNHELLQLIAAQPSVMTVCLHGTGGGGGYLGGGGVWKRSRNRSHRSGLTQPN